MQCMLDFETLGQGADCKVLSLGAVLFDGRAIVDRKYWVFNHETQYNRSADQSTIEWWAKQNEEARGIFKECETVGRNLEECMQEFVEWVAPHKGLVVWSNGATFDIMIMEHILKSYDLAVPWHFWNQRCYRTIKSIFKIENGKKNDQKHNALADAVFQTACLIELFNKGS